MFQPGMGAERERMTFGSCPSLTRGPSRSGTSRAAGDLWPPITAFKPASPCFRTLFSANQRHFRLSPNSFEIPLHDSTPRQKYRAKDRVRGSGHRKLALSQPACCVRLRRETGLASRRARSCRLSANVSGYPDVTGHTLVLDAHCLADCKGLWSKRKPAGSQRTR
jgi:hypothetical protein